MNKDEIKKKFEANMLDGDKVEDCGRAMLSAESVWEFISETYTSMVEGELRKIAKEVGGMAFDKEKSDITQEYQSTFLDGYNQAIEEVQQYLLERKKNVDK